MSPVAHTEHHEGHWRAKLVLHYDGRNYHGWQEQPGRRTVQGELSSLLARLCRGARPTVTAAGRTDQGVHATGQVASALIPDRYDELELRQALNALSPPDLWVASAEAVADTFHPRYDAVSRTYTYRLGVSEETGTPFKARWCWPLGRCPDRSRMDEATAGLAGSHDFSAFAKSGQPARGVLCEVTSVGWRESAELEGILEFEITADRFLHRMVRYLVRTCVEIGEGRRAVQEMSALLHNDGGHRAPSPAPPQGLFLTRVDYSREQSRHP